MPSRGEAGARPPERVPDYETFLAGFRPEDVAALLSGELAKGLNVCTECCDRHAEGDRIALYWEGADGRSSVRFQEAEAGVQPGSFPNITTTQGPKTLRSFDGAADDSRA